MINLKKVELTVDHVAVDNVLKWDSTSKIWDEKSKKELQSGFWFFDDKSLFFQSKGKDKNGVEIFEAEIKIDYDFKTSSAGADAGMTPTTMSQLIDTNVFFTKDAEGNLISTDFKPSKN